jgi:hypothetical protein
MTTIQRFMTKICIFLFLSVPNSKSFAVTYHNKWRFYKPFQTNYDSNVHIATFDHEPPAPTHKLSQTKPAVTSSLLKQTNCKGSFCLIIIYAHKTHSQPQATRAKKQTFSNKTPFPCEAG